MFKGVLLPLLLLFLAMFLAPGICGEAPAGAMSGASYDSVTDLEDWSLGDVNATDVGGPSITGGKLDLTGGSVKYVDYDADLNADSVQKGCVRFKLTPGYSGAPSNVKNFFVITKTSGDAHNFILLRHQSGAGNVLLYMYDATATPIYAGTVLGAWTPIEAVEYELSFNWNLDAGETELFINGTQFGSTQTSTGTRDGDIGLLRIGSNLAGGESSDFLIDDLVVYSDVQHTENYTPGYTLTPVPEPVPEPEPEPPSISGGLVMIGVVGVIGTMFKKIEL